MTAADRLERQPEPADGLQRPPPIARCSPHAPSISPISGPPASGWARRTHSSQAGASSGREIVISPITSSTTHAGSVSIDRGLTELAQPQPHGPHRVVGALGDAHGPGHGRSEDSPGPIRVADHDGVAQGGVHVLRVIRAPATPGRGHGSEPGRPEGVTAARGGTRRTGGGSGTAAADRPARRRRGWRRSGDRARRRRHRHP